MNARSRSSILVVATALLLLAAALLAAGCGSDDEGDGGGEASIESFCDEVASVREEGNPLAAVEGDDVEGAKTAVGAFVDQLESVAEVAPDEIRTNVEGLRDYFSDYLAAVEDVETPEDFKSTSAEFEADNPPPTEANAEIETFTDAECGDADATAPAEEDSSSGE